MRKMNVSSEFLKWFAVLTMTVDHIDRICVKIGWLHDTLGRVAFPLFSFLLLSNFIAYHPVKKYLVRLGGFALITQILFFLFHFESKNVLFSFFYAVLFISATEKISSVFKSVYVQFYFEILLLIGLLPFVLIADYGLTGFLFLLALYAYLRKKTPTNCVAVLLTGIAMNAYGIFPILMSLLTLVLLMFCIQIVRKRRLMRWWFFYLYYPLHKLLLYALSCLS